MRKATVSVSLLQNLMIFAEKRGIDFKELASGDLSDSVIIGDGKSRINAKDFLAIWKKVVERTSDENPGLAFGEEVVDKFPGGSLLFAMMMNSSSLGNSLDLFVRYHAIATDIIQPEMSSNIDLTYLKWKGHVKMVQADFAEAVIAIYYKILDVLSDGKIRPVEVRFSHSFQGNRNTYQDFFESKVQFEAKCSELVIKKQDLELEVKKSNSDLMTVLINHAEKIISTIDNEHELSRKLIESMSRKLLAGEKFNLDTLAREVAMSRRSLQASLQGEGASYRRCLESAKKHIALDFLCKPKANISDLTFLLGYSEQSAFHHAFKRWTGKSPKEYYNNSKL